MVDNFLKWRKKLGLDILNLILTNSDDLEEVAVRGTLGKSDDVPVEFLIWIF